MSKAVLISIQPKWCAKIFRGEKNIEFRKNVPKLELPFKAYVYCTEGKDTLSSIIRDGEDIYGEIYHGKPVFIKYDKDSPAEWWSKKKTVVGEMTIDEIEIVKWDFEKGIALYGGSPGINLKSGGLLLKDFLKYQGKGTVYGWHIKNYKLYKEPMRLEEFGMRHPPQSWQYVEARNGET